MPFAAKRIGERFLTLRPLPVVLAFIAVGLAIPSVWTGWQLDDLVQRYFLLGNPDVTGTPPSPLDMFRFLDGDTVRNRALMDTGILPWWTLPTLRISFWRPLSALSHWLDYVFWPQSGVLMHVQSLLWFAALVAVGTFLYRGMLGPAWASGLASLFFALDDAHGLPAGWLANRNALLAGFFGILVLLAYHRWRQDGWRPGAILAPLFLLLALLSGESALAVCGYLFAYALFMDSGVWRMRLTSLLPSAVVAGGWLVLYAVQGYGTSGSGFYVDPISEPAKFLAAVAWKAPLLLADQLALPPSTFVLFVPSQVLPFILIWGVLILGLIAVMLYPLLRSDRMARFWCTGMILSIPVVCSTMPHSRLLLFAGIGAFGLLAQWMVGVWGGAQWVPGRKAWRIVARIMLVAFVLIHIFVAAALLPFNATSAAFGQAFIQDAAARVSAGPEFQEQDLVILNHPVVFYAHHFQTARILAGQTSPRRVRALASGVNLIRVHRQDECTLVIEPEGGYLAFPFDNVYRGLDHPLRKGDVVALAGMTVEILELTTDGRPAAAAFRFPVALEDASLRWLRWGWEGYVAFELPPVGERADIPPGFPLF